MTRGKGVASEPSYYIDRVDGDGGGNILVRVGGALEKGKKREKREREKKRRERERERKKRRTRHISYFLERAIFLTIFSISYFCY